MSYKHELADNNIICPYLYKKNSVIQPGQLYNDWLKSGQTKSREEIIKKQKDISFIYNSDIAKKTFTDVSGRVKKPKPKDVLSNVPLDEKEAFTLLERVSIYDTTERKMTSDCLKVIPKEKLIPLMLSMEILSKQLLNVVKGHTGVLSTLSDVQVKNFLYHIIAKGKIFYQGTLSDPNFCLYLINDNEYGFQSIYEWISEACDKITKSVKKNSSK